LSIIPKIAKGIVGGAVIQAALGRFAPPEQPSGFNLPAFNEPARQGARNVVSPWPLASKLGWSPGANIANLPSVAGGLVSGPSRSWLAQTYGPLGPQPQREREAAYFAYGRPQEPEVVALDPGPSPISRSKRPRFGTGGIFGRAGEGASVSYLTQVDPEMTTVDRGSIAEASASGLRFSPGLRRTTCRWLRPP